MKTFLCLLACVLLTGCAGLRQANYALDNLGFVGKEQRARSQQTKELLLAEFPDLKMTIGAGVASTRVYIHGLRDPVEREQVQRRLAAFVVAQPQAGVLDLFFQ